MNRTTLRASRGLRVGIAALAAFAALLLGAVPAAAEDPGTGSISGTVTRQDDGTPVAGVQVSASGENGGGITTITDEAGAYTLAGFPSGVYQVRFDPPSGDLLAEYWKDTADQRRGEWITVGDDAIMGIDASLVTAGAISGVVVSDSDGAPVAGVQVSASGDDGNWAFAVTGDDGTYTLTGLRPDAYVVDFYPEGTDLMREYWNDSETWEGATRVALTGGQTVGGIDAALGQGTAISGTVTQVADGAAVGDVLVNALYSSGEIAGYATTGADGSYRIGGLRDGSYLVQFNAAPPLASEYWEDAHGMSVATPVAVKKGAEAKDIDASLSALAQIAGTVMREDGTPAHGLVTATDARGGDPVTAWIGADGEYVLDLAPGTYRLQFSSSDFDVLSEYWNDSPTAAGAALITMGEGEQRSGIDAVLASAAMITGTVHLSVDEAREVFIEALGPDGNPVATAYADFNGSYTLYLPAGTYTLRSGATFYNGSRTTVATQYFAGVKQAKKATAVSAAAGQTTSGIDFTLVAKVKAAKKK